MKTTVLSLCFALLLSFSGKAQTMESSTINFLNTSIAFRAFIQTGPEKKDRVVIEPNTWIAVQSKDGRLPVFVDGKTHLLRFEAGKSYYFLVVPAGNGINDIVERSEQEFLLRIANRSTKGPFDYTWPTSANP